MSGKYKGNIHCSSYTGYISAILVEPFCSTAFKAIDSGRVREFPSTPVPAKTDWCLGVSGGVNIEGMI